jgi:hypothetical protein
MTCSQSTMKNTRVTCRRKEPQVCANAEERRTKPPREDLSQFNIHHNSKQRQRRRSKQASKQASSSKHAGDETATTTRGEQGRQAGDDEAGRASKQASRAGTQAITLTLRYAQRGAALVNNGNKTAPLCVYIHTAYGARGGGRGGGGGRPNHPARRQPPPKTNPHPTPRKVICSTLFQSELDRNLTT